MKPITVKDWGKGVNKDQPAWELAPGFWSDCQNMRFRNGKAERMGGIASAIASPSTIPYGLFGYSSGTTRYVAYGGLTKAYLHDGTSETEITRRTAAQTVTAFTRSSATVTVTTGAVHGLTAGVSSVTIFGVPPAAGHAGGADGCNGSFTVATTPTTTTFTYTATKSGSYTAGAAALTSIGYILNTAATLNFTITADDKITWGNFNGVLVYNNPVDGLYYYDQAGTTRLVSMMAFGAYIADVVRVYKFYLVALAPTTASVKYRHRVMWSASADPGSLPLDWTASATNDAGLQDLVSDGEMVDAREWGNSLILFKRDCRFRMTYIGGNGVFDFQLISGNHKDDGLLAAHCVVNTPKGQVFVTDGFDIRMHGGGESQSIAEGRVRNYFKTNIDSTNRKRAFVALNPPFNEVWVCFPESGQATCTKAMVWNWESDAWGLRDLSGVVAGTSGEFPASIATDARLLIGNNTPKIGLADSGYTDFGSTITSMLERTGMDFDSTDFKTLSDSMPRFDGSSNFAASIFHGSSQTQDGTPTYTSALTYTHNTTTRVNGFAVSGRYLAWKTTMTPADTPSLRSIDFWITPDGEF